MKSTLPRALWPAPAGRRASAPRADAELDKTANRLPLTLVDEFSEQRSRGYNPYDTRPAKRATEDVWRRKPKRD